MAFVLTNRQNKPNPELELAHSVLRVWSEESAIALKLDKRIREESIARHELITSIAMQDPFGGYGTGKKY